MLLRLRLALLLLLAGRGDHRPSAGAATRSGAGVRGQRGSGGSRGGSGSRGRHRQIPIYRCLEIWMKKKKQQRGKIKNTQQRKKSRGSACSWRCNLNATICQCVASVRRAKSPFNPPAKATMATLARMQYHQRQAFQADSDDDEDAVMNAPGPNNPDARYAADDDGLDADEAEQERLLSEQFGEAGEAPSSDKRGAATDQDIAAELAGEVRRAKKARPTLQPSDLIGAGPNGLHRVKNEFPDQVRYRSGVDRLQARARQGGQKQKPTREQLRRAELNAAAAYSRDLLSAYRSYCRDLRSTKMRRRRTRSVRSRLRRKRV